MKTVCIFNPLHIFDNKISVSDIDGLKILKLYEHPEIRPQIEVMKTEVMKYQTLPGSISPTTRDPDLKGSLTCSTTGELWVVQPPIHPCVRPTDNRGKFCSSGN